MTIAFWACAIVTLVSAGVSLFYAVDGARTSRADAVLPSRYALARSIALFATAVAAPFSASEAFVAAIATALIVVQALDAMIGVGIRDRLKTVGPAATALAGLACLLWMFAT